MTGYFGSNYFASRYWASYYWRGVGVVPPVPTPDAAPAADAVGLLERSGREGGFLVPPGMAVFGKFSKEVSDPWLGRQNPYGMTDREKERAEAEELSELMELLEIMP